MSIHSDIVRQYSKESQRIFGDLVNWTPDGGVLKKVKGEFSASNFVDSLANGEQFVNKTVKLLFITAEVSTIAQGDAIVVRGNSYLVNSVLDDIETGLTTITLEDA